MDAQSLASFADLVAVSTLEQAGLVNTEISEAKARRIYGKFFTDNVANGRLTPSRQGKGHRWYNIKAILALRSQEELDSYNYRVSTAAVRRAQIQMKIEN